jgi:16S rRNA (cytosine1402-N4)-methyltransferase
LRRPKLEAIDPTGDSFQLFHNNFAALPTVLAQAGAERVDGILADLGVASPQIDDPSRGFSYRQPGPLDMRMDPTRGQPAWAWISRMSERELAAALLELGDEDDAAEIARLIVQRRKEQPITTTEQLTAIVCEARDFTLQRAAGAKLHPAARTFQALRILVNRELANLDRLLQVLPQSLNPGGVAAIISFHSGEDRRVKDHFRDAVRGGIYEADQPRAGRCRRGRTEAQPKIAIGETALGEDSDGGASSPTGISTPLTWPMRVGHPKRLDPLVVWEELLKQAQNPRAALVARSLVTRGGSIAVDANLIAGETESGDHGLLIIGKPQRGIWRGKCRCSPASDRTRKSMGP